MAGDVMTTETGKENGKILVVGGGISGLTIAVEAAEVGCEVVIVEKNPYLGGRVAQMNQYFPKLCPPYCGLEINFKRIRNNGNIRFHTLCEIEKVSGQAGNYDVTVRMKPRYVNEKCTACGECVAVCPVERENEFNYGMDKTKAIYCPHEMAAPMRYVIDDTVCKGTSCAKCAEVCKYGAIDLEMKPKEMNLKASAIVFATGWKPYDAAKIDNLCFGKYQNILTNVMVERLAAQNGPTGGRLIRPSDGKEIKSVAFVQCAGSRDENHLPYCSTVCCSASLKQTTFFREQYPDSKIYIFYIDVRTPGRLEDFFTKVKDDENVTLIKGKVAKITEDAATKDLTVEAEDTMTGQKVKVKVELVVLATGMVPNDMPALPAEMSIDEDGFIFSDPAKSGIYATGCAKKPIDVAVSIQDATGTTLKAIQCVRR
ncbi:MAG: CoB--CoM heterodisulfide reductase iron-sulfur subunit A family protein [bacterium]